MPRRVSALIVLAVLACREKAVTPLAPATPPVPGRQVSALRSDPACAAPFDAPGAREKLRTATGELKIGALAGLKHADEENVAFIRRLAAALERRQLHSEGACVYVQKDIEAVSAALDRITPPAIFVAAVPPRGQDVRALDVSEGQNLGDPRLSQLLQKAQFGIFGQVWESGGRAVDGRGAPVPPKTEVAQLYLNPGAAERQDWPMADGTSVAGQAALLTVHGRKAAWEVVRLQA